MLPVPRPRSANKEWEQLKHEIEVAHDLVMWSCSAVREGNADPSAALASVGMTMIWHSRVGFAVFVIPPFAHSSYFADFCWVIQVFTRSSNMSMGRAPESRISSWKARMSNFGPSASCAFTRRAISFSCPIL